MIVQAPSAPAASSWLAVHFPSLVRTGPAGLAWWQLIALPLIIVLALVVGRLLGRATSALALRVTARTTTEWDDIVVARLRGPTGLGWALGILYVSLHALELPSPLQNSVDRGLGTAALVCVFWAASRIIDVFAQIVGGSEWSRGRPASRAFIPLAARVIKVIVVAMAVVAVLSQLGYPVASLLAGLGIGGLALALAAQKTVENLFGAFAMGVDQPFREGDFVRVEDFVGTVECIGLRSTRFRTLDRTLVSIPNGRLADMRVETFSARDRMRLACTIGLVYETSVAQLRAILGRLEEVLRSHPKIWPDAVVVRFKEFGASSLDIEVMAWFETREWSEFQRIREEILLGFFDAVAAEGSAFAFPTRTVHLASVPGAGRATDVRTTTNCQPPDDQGARQ